jgi:hypothetical protein
MSNQSYKFAVAATLSLAVAVLLFLDSPVRAQSTVPPDTRPGDNRSFQDNDGRRGQLAQFDQFLDSHPEIAEQLRRDPSLTNDREFVQNHPALRSYLDNNPAVRDQLRQDPNVFMRQEDRFDRREDARDDRDISRRNLTEFDRFLDNHREIAEQVRRNPSLIDNHEFVRNHPALQAYLQDNPGVRDQIRQDPNAFMRDEDRFERTENGHMRDSSRERMASFGEFLGGHERIKQDVSKDPMVVRNREYVENHPDLSDYLKAHPDVKQDWTANPHEFVRGTQQFTNGSPTPGATTPGGTTSPGLPMTNGTNPNSGATGNSAPNPAPAQNPNKPRQ